MDDNKPPLYTSLRRIVESGEPISANIYEAYGPVIVALASVTVITGSQTAQVELDSSKFLESKAILMESQRIQSQQYAQVVKNPSKVFLLTPDQQQALQGPRRQFIIGAPGTGKTIVLQTKAIELLRQKQSVLILAPESYASKYANLFENENFEKKTYEVFSYAKLDYFTRWKSSKCNENFGIFNSKLYSKKTAIWEIYDFIRNEMTAKPSEWDNSFDWLLTHDNIFIDDALGETSPVKARHNFIYYLIVLACAEVFFS